jgi:protein-tyrosine-phosphatase
LQHYINSVIKEFDKISEVRKEHLLQLANYFQEKYKAGKTPKAIVICTHNSRRSHLGQVWLAVAADYYSLPKLETYSGGTEATAFNPRAVSALKRTGLQITVENTEVENPIYELRWNDNMQPYQAFSKKYDSEPNPTEDFAAIMVCTDADEKCPLVFGADFRISLPFDDPKAYDNTVWETAKYDKRCRQIAAEMFFCLSQVKLAFQ